MTTLPGVGGAVKPVSQGLLVGGGGNLGGGGRKVGGCGRKVGGLSVCGDGGGCSIATVVPCNLAGAARCVVSVVSSSSTAPCSAGAGGTVTGFLVFGVSPLRQHLCYKRLNI